MITGIFIVIMTMTSFNRYDRENRDKGVGTGVVMKAVGFRLDKVGEWEFLRVSDWIATICEA